MTMIAPLSKAMEQQGISILNDLIVGDAAEEYVKVFIIIDKIVKGEIPYLRAQLMEISEKVRK